MQIEYGTKTDLRMYGNMGIIKGNYNFSLQQIIHKDFKIREGSSIDFRGDPFNATMQINAIYNVTANLRDLDENLAQESPRTNIPVNCVLNLDGMLRSPAISFDLELPGSNEEIERQMKALVDTEDMMTRQIIYLQVLAKRKLIWDYLLPDAEKRLRKKILKSNQLSTYQQAVKELLQP